MTRLWEWVRVGLRDLGGDVRRFGLIITSLALGTAIVVMVGATGTSLRATMERDAALILGGDVEFARTDRDADGAELAILAGLGDVAHVVELAVRGTANDKSALIDLVAVSANYPLRGEVDAPGRTGGQTVPDLLARQNGRFGILVNAVLLDRLGVSVGDAISIGGADIEVRGTLRALPDSAVRGFRLGLTALVADAALFEIGQVTPPLPGLLTRHKYKVLRAADKTEADQDALRAQLGPAWSARTPRDAAGSMVRYYDQFLAYLLIVGLLALMIGGVGVSNGITAHITERQRAVAILRSLGATRMRVFVHYLTHVAVLAGLGGALGLVIGIAATLGSLPLIGGAIGVPITIHLDLAQLAATVAFTLLAAFAFAYLPLTQAQAVSPATLFRSTNSALPPITFAGLMRPGLLLPLLLSVAGLILLAMSMTGRPQLTLWFALALIVALAVLQLPARGLRLLRGLSTTSNWRLLRQILRDISAPRANARSVLVSLGAALAVLLAIALTADSLTAHLGRVVGHDAPSFVATDLFEDEAETIAGLVETDPAFAGFAAMPMLRAELLQLKDWTAPQLKGMEQEDISALVAGPLPVTWQRDKPAGARLAAGDWWPPDYDGPPLVSLRATLRGPLGLSVGDKVVFQMFGERVEATIANFRDYAWQSGIGFLVTFSPGMIESYPATLLGNIVAAPGRETDVERTLAAQLPDVRFLPVGDALQQLGAVMGQLMLSVMLVGTVAVVNGLLVLTGTLAAGRKQREADAIVQRVLGATRRDLMRRFAVEFGVLGLAAGASAAAVGAVANWALGRFALGIETRFNVALAALLIGLGVALVVAAIHLTSRRVLSLPPARYLRGQ
jgi:putative ABC transport system permease protein